MNSANATVIFTDGACKGNPGPGGWAWAVPGGRWASGFDEATTNQRMEITAAYMAVRDNPGVLHIVSDSTYVVNCFRDGWWKGWKARGWKNSKKEPVANRDLWEPFIDLVNDRQVTFEWVKGHSGNEMNDLVDRLAVEAVDTKHGASGEEPPQEGGSVDLSGNRQHQKALATEADSELSPVDVTTTTRAVIRDRRVPAGTLWTIVGLRYPGLGESDSGKDLRRHMARVIEAQNQLSGDVVVLTGARPGAEQLGALAAADVGVPYVVILPYPDPIPRSAQQELTTLKEVCAGALSVVTLESKRPVDGQGRSAALARRDGWLRSVSSGALVVIASESKSRHDPKLSRVIDDARDQLAKFTKSLGDDVWELPVAVG